MCGVDVEALGNQVFADQVNQVYVIVDDQDVMSGRHSEDSVIKLRRYRVQLVCHSWGIHAAFLQKLHFSRWPSSPSTTSSAVQAIRLMPQYMHIDSINKKPRSPLRLRAKPFSAPSSINPGPSRCR